MEVKIWETRAMFKLPFFFLIVLIMLTCMSSFTLKHPNSNLTQGTISRLELGFGRVWCGPIEPGFIGLGRVAGQLSSAGLEISGLSQILAIPMPVGLNLKVGWVSRVEVWLKPQIAYIAPYDCIHCPLHITIMICFHSSSPSPMPTLDPMIT